MDFIVVFDITKAGYKGSENLIFGSFLIIIGIFLCLGLNTKIFKIPVRFKRKFNRIFSIIYLVFAICFTTVNLIFTYPDYYEIKKAYLSNQCIITEGYIKNFRPMSDNGNAFEEFEVDKMKFKYSSIYESPGFDNNTSYAGIINEGLYVKIYSHKGIIAKLEIRK